MGESLNFGKGRDRLVNVRVILVGTTHPGNIGATARAMKNMGVTDLVLVNPRFFPHEDATARASGAEDVLENARVVSTLADAVADCSFVAGASARSRAIEWPSLAPRECAVRILQEPSDNCAAIVFGPESSGLKNDDLDRCNVLLTIPTNPSFSSLNIAMAVQVICYELRVAALTVPSPAEPEAPPATGADLEHFYAHMEAVLTASGFLKIDEPRLLMRRLRRLFTKAELDKNEINIMRGILSSLDPARIDSDASD